RRQREQRLVALAGRTPRRASRQRRGLWERQLGRDAGPRGAPTRRRPLRRRLEEEIGIALAFRRRRQTRSAVAPVGVHLIAEVERDACALEELERARVAAVVLLDGGGHGSGAREERLHVAGARDEPHLAQDVAVVGIGGDDAEGAR